MGGNLSRINDTIYYVDTGGNIRSTYAKDPSSSASEAYQNTQVMDRRTTDLLEKHRRSEPRYRRKNMDVIGDLLVKYLGKPVNLYYGALEKRLATMDRDRENAKKYRDAIRAERRATKASVSIALSGNTSAAEAHEILERQRRTLAEGSILVYGGIVEYAKDHSKFFVRYVMRHSITEDRLWELATKHRMELCRYAFECIRISTVDIEKIDRGRTYIPTNMSLGTAGELTIEFTRRK